MTLGTTDGRELGSVDGSVLGNVLGSVDGSVLGNMLGSIDGNVLGNVLGSVDGSVLGRENAVEVVGPVVEGARLKLGAELNKDGLREGESVGSNDGNGLGPALGDE